ncbi:hypothetical protein ACFVT9_28980 [Kitasatospora cineracea]|uniref:hypothetical protein n=1 Tax=Kitasatospora cineracea TaxID=88074 RepID=UPI0036DDBA1C
MMLLGNRGGMEAAVGNQVLKKVGRRPVPAWALVAGWGVLAAAGSFAGTSVGMVAFGSVPALLLGGFLGRSHETAALAVAVGAGVIALPVAAAATGSLHAAEPGDGLLVLLALAMVGSLFYALPLVVGGCVGMGLAVRGQR